MSFECTQNEMRTNLRDECCADELMAIFDESNAQHLEIWIWIYDYVSLKSSIGAHHVRLFWSILIGGTVCQAYQPGRSCEGEKQGRQQST
jgi:hypothetical protein